MKPAVGFVFPTPLLIEQVSPFYKNISSVMLLSLKVVTSSVIPKGGTEGNIFALIEDVFILMLKLRVTQQP